MSLRTVGFKTAVSTAPRMSTESIPLILNMLELSSPDNAKKKSGGGVHPNNDRNVFCKSSPKKGLLWSVNNAVLCAWFFVSSFAFAIDGGLR